MSKNYTILSLTRAQLGLCLVNLALRYNGVREQPLGSNSGPMVRRFQAATTLARTQPTGWPWCAAFDAFIMQELWRELGIQAPNPWPATASCDELLYWARREGILFDDPEPFDFFLSMKSKGDAVHTGLVIDVQPDREIETIEGNTNNSGSREGIGVFVFKDGNAKHEAGRTYVRWLLKLPELISIAPPAPTPLLDQLSDFAFDISRLGSVRLLGVVPRPKSLRLVLALPPYSPDDYYNLESAQYAGGAWTVEGKEIESLVANHRQKSVRIGDPSFAGRDRIRTYLKAAGWAVDEKRTQLGNHLADTDPRQYVFVASG
ncbi:MAG TPA: hypothetical protein VGB77_06565 [Abditibacteriaceae bacterium]|jgi:hypothetical protein